MCMTFREVVPYILATLALVTLLGLRPRDILAHQASTGSIVGTVRDQAGGNVTAAQVALVYPQQAILRTTVTDARGHFNFDSIPVGAYEIRITQAGFGAQRVAVQVSSGKTVDLEIILEVAPLSSQVTVTAETGQAQDKDRVPQAVNIISEIAIQQRNALREVARFSCDRACENKGRSSNAPPS